VLLYTIPYILLNRLCPVIGHKPWPIKINSVFTTLLSDILFTHSPGIQDGFKVIAVRIKEARCYQIGLSLAEHVNGYSFW